MSRAPHARTHARDGAGRTHPISRSLPSSAVHLPCSASFSFCVASTCVATRLRWPRSPHPPPHISCRAWWMSCAGDTSQHGRGGVA